jgi:hypothetical protein
MGQKCEELRLNKSVPPCRDERTSFQALQTFADGQEPTFFLLRAELTISVAAS